MRSNPTCCLCVSRLPLSLHSHSPLVRRHVSLVSAVLDQLFLWSSKVSASPPRLENLLASLKNYRTMVSFPSHPISTVQNPISWFFVSKSLHIKKKEMPQLLSRKPYTGNRQRKVYIWACSISGSLKLSQGLLFCIFGFSCCMVMVIYGLKRVRLSIEKWGVYYMFIIR